MRKLNVFICSMLLSISTWAIAEEAELLDAYLEDLPSTTTHVPSSSQGSEAGSFVGQPVEVIVDENGQSHEVVQSQTIEYRRIETADGSELYEEVIVDAPATSVTDMQMNSDVIITQEAVVNHQPTAQPEEDLEIIELEAEEAEFVVIEAPENQTIATTHVNSGKTMSAHEFCQQNPYARECLLSKYLSLCKKDPQSTDCKSQLQKFDGFCGTFPNAYKCKKAKIAASCKQNPQTNECKSISQRYCQRYPKAIFCNYN